MTKDTKPLPPMAPYTMNDVRTYFATMATKLAQDAVNEYQHREALGASPKRVGYALRFADYYRLAAEALGADVVPFPAQKPTRVRLETKPASTRVRLL